MVKIFTLLISFFSLLSANINLDTLTTPNEKLILWSAIFSILILAVLILFFTLKKLEACKRIVQEKERTSFQEDQIISNISKNIQDMSTNNEVRALTTDIIDFLRIKSKKTKLIQGTLDFSNLLNDVSGTIKENIKHTPLHLHYNLSPSISQYIYADTLHLARILENIILYCVRNNTHIIEVNIDKKSTHSKKENIFFTIETNINMDLEKNESLFNSKYNKINNSYESLDLFIAKELVSLMKGNLIARNNTKGNVEFLFDIPYIEDITTRQEIAIEKKHVLVVDSYYGSALCTQNIFRTLGHDVAIISKEEYARDGEDFSNYDLIIVEDKLCKDQKVHNFNNKTQTITLSNLFGESTTEHKKCTPHALQKPLTSKQIQTLLEILYTDSPLENTIESYRKNNALHVHRGLFEEYSNVNLLSFSKFEDYKILLVEDNVINQKVFQGILGPSNISITVANHGEEALKILASEKEFDIVFMDINMPIMDGYTATEIIRQNNSFMSLPIIALSALTSPNEIDSMYNAGMNGYLEKPLRKGKLFQAMLTFLDSNENNIVEYKEENIQYLDGLNIQQGILNANSNTIFYKEILLEFQDAYHEDDKTFYTLAKEFKYDELKLLCLDMRGLSGSIGAEDMNQLVEEILQKIIAKEYHTIIEYAHPYRKELKRILSSIKKYIS